MRRWDNLLVEGISKRFGAFWALREASFTLRTGEVLGLIGPNGSGKTTLFRCVAGVMPTTAGSLSLDGRALSRVGRKEVLYFVPDGIRPWPHQHVRWVLKYVAGLHGVNTTMHDDVTESLGLEPLLGAQLQELSKGEHRRVMLAVGLLVPQPVLMLDEPFDGLDLRQTREMMRVLRAHGAAGRTLLLSIHHLGDAERVCDRLVLLSTGRVVAEGTMPELRMRAKVDNGSIEDIFLALT